MSSLRHEAVNVVLGTATGSAFSLVPVISVLRSPGSSSTWTAATIAHAAIVAGLSIFTAASVLSIVRAPAGRVALARADRLMPIVVGYAILLGVGCVGVLPAAFVVWRCMKLREALQAMAMNEAA